MKLEEFSLGAAADEYRHHIRNSVKAFLLPEVEGSQLSGLLDALPRNWPALQAIATQSKAAFEREIEETMARLNRSLFRYPRAIRMTRVVRLADEQIKELRSWSRFHEGDPVAERDEPSGDDPSASGDGSRGCGDAGDERSFGDEGSPACTSCHSWSC